MTSTLKPSLRRAAAVCGLLAAGAAQAAIITFDLQASFAGDPLFAGSSCAAGGCLVGGRFVINDQSGAVLSVNLSASGFSSPGIGPFTQFSALRNLLGETNIQFNDSPFESAMSMFFATPTTGSLVGYAGGAISTQTVLRTQSNNAGWELTSGTLTVVSAVPETAVPEPGSLALVLPALAGLACFSGLRARRPRQAGVASATSLQSTPSS